MDIKDIALAIAKANHHPDPEAYAAEVVAAYNQPAEAAPIPEEPSVEVQQPADPQPL